MEKITITFNVTLTKELKEYIADCWITFITEDLGLKPCDAIMIFDN